MHWNARVNLTGAADRDTLVREHFPDAFVLAAAIPAGARVVDVGAGGGLPGLPLAILRTDLSIDLFEPRHKRAAFLRHAVARLGLLNAKVETTRIEPDQPPSGASYDFAVSRATFAPETWLRLGLSLVSPGCLVGVLHTEPLRETSSPPRPVPVGSPFETHFYRLSGGQPRNLSVFQRP